MHSFEKPDNLVALIENSLEKYPDNVMFGTKNKDGDYEWVTYRDVGKRIDNLRGGLSQAGIGTGDAVGIVKLGSDNPNGRFFGVVEDSTHYDLVINSDRLSTGTAVALIEAACRGS